METKNERPTRNLRCKVTGNYCNSDTQATFAPCVCQSCKCTREGTFYVGIVVRDGDRFLALKFVKKTSRMWRFPGGKLEPGETPLMAAARELREEVGLEALSLRYLTTIVHDVDDKTWAGYIFSCDSYEGYPTLLETDKHEEMQFVSLKELMGPEFSVITEYFDVECDPEPIILSPRARAASARLLDSILRADVREASFYRDSSE